jgi:MoxR-like ATPase
VAEGLSSAGYLAGEGLATVVFLALRLRRPLLLEGEAGVGKTELAKAIARWRSAELIRLQCYEGIDVSQALYEWDYPRQLLHLRALEALSGRDRAGDLERVEGELYSERFLIRRALLRAFEAPSNGVPPVLLVDEVDRADDEFEAFLLEALSDWQVTVPELGTIRAAEPPVVVVTSNRTRDVHDALKRRCLYHWVDFPDVEREVEIVRLRVPGLSARLAAEVAQAMSWLRGLGLYKPPGIAEAIDWAEALVVLGVSGLDAPAVAATLGAVVKYREDTERVEREGVDTLIEHARRGGFVADGNERA